MPQSTPAQRAPQYWFVGATYNDNEDQTERFIRDGLWENGYEDKYLALVRSIQVGDRIAIKSTYTRKYDLPFDNRGHAVSVLAIKAVGTVTANVGDGRTLRVDWTAVDPQREWYFYTYRATVWHVQPDEWYAEALIAFTFNEIPQDIDRFRNDPSWRERFGDRDVDTQRFRWTTFYEAIADKLLAYRNNRAALLDGVRGIASRVEGLGYLEVDQYVDGTKGFVRDICPFTTMGLFNRGTTDANRRAIAKELAGFLQVTEPIPQSFEGIPLLNNMSSWFFAREARRDPNAIDANWTLFEAALRLADSDDADQRDVFMGAFDNASMGRAVGWKLTFGLYWMRPWDFPSLDQNSRTYISEKLGVEIPRNGPKGRCSGADYLQVLDSIEPRFKEENYPVHSFPELSYAAWMYEDTGASAAVASDEADDEDVPDEQERGAAVAAESAPRPLQTYSIDEVVADGCFLDRERLETMLSRLRTKKNLILQGPPGTGKTWLARRLAYALIGHKDETKVRAVQFHPNLSYEDFVRGWRPVRDGKLELADGVFMEAVRAAQKDPHARIVVVIEEINRGNPAQVFGEMLTLLETDKRTPSEALELSHRARDGERERVFVPDNLYVIGTMNIADRSLALVDLALRRRFAFVGLEPSLGAAWRRWVTSRCGITPEFASEVERRLSALNQEIAADPSLGSNFAVGHSYVTPPITSAVRDGREWFRHVVETEIGPLLDEYWFDAAEKARAAKGRLLDSL